MKSIVGRASAAEKLMRTCARLQFGEEPPSGGRPRATRAGLINEMRARAAANRRGGFRVGRNLAARVCARAADRFARRRAG